MRDLFVLVPDKNSEHALRGAFSRHQALGCRPISYDIDVHPGKDGGVRMHGAAYASLRRRTHAHALVVLDYEGCGESIQSASQVEQWLDDKLVADWGTQAKAIVVAPEIDIWMWGASNALQQTLNWNLSVEIRQWLLNAGFQLLPSGKPVRPKEAMEAVFREIKRPRSSSDYERIAHTISLQQCSDTAFQRLRTQLCQWFP